MARKRKRRSAPSGGRSGERPRQARRGSTGEKAAAGGASGEEQARDKTRKDAGEPPVKPAALPAALAPRRTRLLLYGGLLAVHVAVALLFLLDRSPGTAAAVHGLPLDDAWIHLVYARSLSAFEGFAYNAGQAAAGFTSPLWALVLAPLFWLRVPGDVPLPLVVKMVGVLFAWVGGIAGLRLGTRLAGLGAGVALALLLALDPWLGLGAVSGMEVPLAIACLLWALDALVARRHRAAGIGLALAFLARPELAVVALAVGVSAARRARADGDRRPLLELTLPVVGAGILWALYDSSVTGHLLPSAFYVKHQPTGVLDAFSDAGAVLGTQLLDMPWMFLGSGFLLITIGAVRMVRTLRPRETAVTLLTAAALWILAIIWAHDINEPLAFYWHRYLDPGVPLLLIPLAVGLATVGEALVALVRSRSGPVPLSEGAAAALPGPMRKAGAVLAVPLLGLMLWALPSRMAAAREHYAWSCQNIQDLQVALGAWLRENSDPGDRIATHDAGAIRFVSNRTVIDILGINSPDVLQEGAAAVIGQRPPRYLVIIPAWYPDLASDPRLVEVYRVHADGFVICQHCGQDEMVVYEPASR